MSVVPRPNGQHLSSDYWLEGRLSELFSAALCTPLIWTCVFCMSFLTRPTFWFFLWCLVYWWMWVQLPVELRCVEWHITDSLLCKMIFQQDVSCTCTNWQVICAAITTIDSSHMTVSSSTSWSSFSPPLNFVSGHLSIVWFMVCRWPQSQEGDWTRPHLCRFARHGPLSVRKWLSRDRVWRGRWKPGCQIIGLFAIEWLTTEADDQSSLHCIVVSTGAMSDLIGCRDTNRGGGCSKTSACTGQFALALMIWSMLSVAALQRREVDTVVKFVHLLCYRSASEHTDTGSHQTD